MTPEVPIHNQATRPDQTTAGTVPSRPAHSRTAENETMSGRTDVSLENTITVSSTERPLQVELVAYSSVRSTDRPTESPHRGT